MATSFEHLKCLHDMGGQESKHTEGNKTLFDIALVPVHGHLTLVTSEMKIAYL